MCIIENIGGTSCSLLLITFPVLKKDHWEGPLVASYQFCLSLIGISKMLN